MSTLRTFFPPVTPATQPFMQVQDQKPTGTSGGASVVGNNHRDLNTVVHNDIVGASLSSNQVTLPAGTYYIEGDIVSGGPGLGQVRSFLRNATSGDTLIGGLSLYSNSQATNLICIPTMFSGILVLSAITILGVVTYTYYAAASTGLGVTSIQLPYDVYTDLRIWQLKEGI